MDFWLCMRESRWDLLCSPKQAVSRPNGKLSPKRGALTQAKNSRLSENGSNSTPFGFECSPERRSLAWARWASLSENSKYSLFSISLKRKLFAWARDPFRLSESSLAWARLTTELFKCLYAPMIDLFTLLKHEIWCQCFIQRACVFLKFLLFGISCFYMLKPMKIC